jgi:hypothetical protein
MCHNLFVTEKQNTNRINKIVAHAIWRSLTDGDTPEDIENADVTSERTATRLKTAKTAFENKLPMDDLSQKTGWSKEFLENKLKPWWEDYANSTYICEYGEHLDQLNDLAAMIRECIVNPQTETKHYPSHISTWIYGGQDFRLTPTTWGVLVMPYLGDEKIWDKPIPIRYLFEHLKVFKQHYDGLNNELNNLTKEFSGAAEIIKKENGQMFKQWEHFDESSIDYALENKPLKSLFLPEDVDPLDWDENYYDEILKVFRQHIPDLDKKYDMLEELLQELYDDLDKYKVKQLIKLGRCEKCNS